MVTQGGEVAQFPPLCPDSSLSASLSRGLSASALLLSGLENSVCGPVLCTAGCLAVSLASTHQKPEHLFSLLRGDSPKCLQTSPNVRWQGGGQGGAVANQPWLRTAGLAISSAPFRRWAKGYPVLITRLSAQAPLP